MQIPEINFIAILAGFAINLVVGNLWYSKYLFGKIWVKLKNFQPEDSQTVNPLMFFSGLGGLAASVLLWIIVEWSQADTFFGGVIVGLLAGLLAQTTMYNEVMFDKPSNLGTRFKIFLIGSGNTLLTFALIGGAFAVWSFSF
jgi:hypothetical protein